MKTTDITSTEDFITFLSKHHDFVAPESEAYPNTICGTGFQSEVLYVLPSAKDLKNIANYDNIKYVTINNYKIDKKAIQILKQHKDRLENVKFLHIWNIKQDDLALLELFPGVTHLLISHVRKADFSFNGLDYLSQLDTLVLFSANQLRDFNFLTRQHKEKIKHLNLTYATKLTKLDGIADFKNLETLTLFASTIESRKTVTLESIEGLENLAELHFFEIDFFNFDMPKLQEKLRKLKNLVRYKVKQTIYENMIQ